MDWVELYFQQDFNERDPIFIIWVTSKYKVKKNKVANRQKISNNKIPLNWQNLSYFTF